MATCGGREDAMATVRPLFTSSEPKQTRPEVRYIKLGPGGSWAERSLEKGEIHFGHHNIPHEVALSGNRLALEAARVRLGHSPGKAADLTREVLDFYQLGPDAIWITFHGGYLWWATADEDVIPNEPSETTGSRFRRTREGWRNTNLLGRELREQALSTRLTKVAAYRQTLCRVEAAEYLLRKLAGEEEPLVTSALETRANLVTLSERLIATLHWRDFETLVDLLLARSGWHRVSTLGGTMKDADLYVQQAVTGETALVQVKSAASQATLDGYIARFDESGIWSRLIFVCHSPKSSLGAQDRPDVLVWAQRPLAEAVFRNGLFDWLVERVA